MALSPISVHLEPHQWYNTMVSMLTSSVVYCGLRIRTMCSSGTTCLSMDCCFSDLTLYKIWVLV